MIDHVTLSNFKSHETTTLDLSRLTVLVGPNGSGKTSVLQALHLMLKAVDTELNTFLSWNEVKEWAYGSEVEFALDLRGTQLANASEEWHLVLNLMDSPSEAILKWKWRNSTDSLTGSGVWENAWSNLMGMRGSEFSEVVGGVQYLKMNAKRLGQPSLSKQVPPQLEEDGFGLASVIGYMLTYENERIDQVLSSIQQVIANVEKVRVRPKVLEVKEERILNIEGSYISVPEGRTERFDELVFDVKGAQRLPASVMSEGTLIATALIAVLESSSCPKVLLLDDIEQGLHPKAQRELVQQLNRIMEERPELQIVATTHSPYIVDELEPEEVVLLALNAEGSSEVKRLSDHPRAGEALEVLTTGEFWSAEGEEWVLNRGQ